MQSFIEFDDGERPPKDAAIERAQRFLDCAQSAPEPMKTTLILNGIDELHEQFHLDTPRCKTAEVSK